MNIKKKYVILAVIVPLFIFLDQITKAWATQRLKGKPAITVIDNYFHLKYVTNRGAAWGMFGSWGTSLRIPFFILITIIASVILGYYYKKLKENQTILQFALALIISGMIGNFIDRVFVTFVVDFIDWHIGIHHWPTFNIADVAISTGMGLLALDWVLHHKEYEKENGQKHEKEEIGV